MRIAIGVFLLVVLIGLIGLVIHFTVSKKGISDSEQQSDPSVTVIPPSCGDGWMTSRDKCYYFSDAEGNWTTANDSCALMNSFLAVIVDQNELNFTVQQKDSSDYWIGLNKDKENKWKWVDGSEYKPWFEVKGGSQCAYLNHEGITSARCPATRHWICTGGINTRE